MGLRLSSGDRVAIIGGGPAGSFTALHMLKQSEELSLQLEVMIFEPRNYQLPGPASCNRCAGILSSRLLEDLERLGISLPEDVVQSEIRAYSVHLDHETVRIDQPNPQERIISIYRGVGPRDQQGGQASSFDGFLLEQACQRGARRIKARVISVSGNEKPSVQTTQETFTADLVILATGVNSRSPLDESFDYQPPQTETMAQDEFLLPRGWPADMVSAYFQKPAGLVFGALIPKGQYVNISLLGQGLGTEAIRDFIEAHNLDQDLPMETGSLCGCIPRIAVGAAGHYYGNRWVAVGDAAVTRLYKDGIGTAFSTAEKAVHSALSLGISEGAFRKGYAPLCKNISKDNSYGRILFQLWTLTLRSRLLMNIWLGVIQSEESLPYAQRIHSRILWGMFTGSQPYRDLLRSLFRVKTLLPLYQSVKKDLGKRATQDYE